MATVNPKIIYHFTDGVETPEYSFNNPKLPVVDSDVKLAGAALANMITEVAYTGATLVTTELVGVPD